MTKKLFMLLALVMTTMTASAVAGYTLSVGTSEHGTIAFTDKNGQTIEYAAEGDKVTVTITPTTGYVVNQPSGQWYAAVAKARTRADIDLLKDVELTSAGQNTWTFTMARANVEISATYKKLLTNQDITVDDIAAQTYTASAIEPTITVKDGTTTLTKDTDYTVAYSNNVNAGTATVTITAVATSENYSGEITKTFTIQKAPLTTVILDTTTLEYTRGEQSVEVTGVNVGDLTVALTDVTISGTSGTDAGTYTVTVTAKADAQNFTGSATAEFTIEPKSITADMVAVDGTTYTGEPLEPAVSVHHGDVPLEEDTEYTISYSNNTEVGDGSVTVSGTGNYGGSVTVKFAILPDVSDVTIDASEGNNDDEDVDNVKMKVEVTDYSAITREERTFEDPETGEEVTREVYVAPVELSEITIPAQEEVVNPETGEKEKAEIMVYIPATFVSADGSTLFEVTRIGADAIKSDTETAIVSTIVLPETEQPIDIEEGAFAVDNLPADNPAHRSVSIKTPLRLLDDYALMKSLKENYEHEQVSAEAQTVNHYWTFSCGVDVKRPAGVRLFICKDTDDETVTISELDEDVIKANNGVLVACVYGDGNAYEMVARPSEDRPSGTTPSTDNAKTYQGNLLIPVIENEHFAPSTIYIMVGNEFHELSATDVTSVPACKAVMPRTSPSQARSLSITVGGDTTGIGVVELLYGEGEKSQWYDLQGNRISRPSRKGVYILNGHKVTVK